ncbi:hypothetical protein [Streptomyces sp. MA5143a]|uniref:hypothetical protein n=1 Tax=Streptomyces sp. MA5143a TaxID=2083010 RepID=UPI000D19981C|nr:hypothetical protein [Streptomyces sp. MA5143a]
MKPALQRTLAVSAGAFALATVVGVAPASASASGCHSSACVRVEGSKLHVDWIKAYSGDERFHGKFKIYAEKAHYVKWSPLATYYNTSTHQTFYKVDIDKNWPDGTDVCVQAFVEGTASNGTACVTVHD